jgi:hypothetical protein
MGLLIAHVIDKCVAHARHLLRHRSVRKNGGIQVSEHFDNAGHGGHFLSWLELAAKKISTGRRASRLPTP